MWFSLAQRARLKLRAEREKQGGQEGCRMEGSISNGEKTQLL